MNTKQMLTYLLENPDALMKEWQPRIRFQITSKLEPRDFLNLLHSLFREFVMRAEPERAQWNEHNAFRFGEENGGEGGMGGFNFNGAYFDHCKLYRYDGTRSGQNYASWKGFMIRNHEDQRLRTPLLYEVADGLETLLQEKKISYERYGIKVGNHKEELQSQSSPES